MEILEIPLASCVHYTGFRYGRNEFNPLERGARDLHDGLPLFEIRRRFVEFLLYYRPRSLGEALGIQLSQHCPLWAYPWFPQPEARRSPTHGWLEDPGKIRDIITHFSDAGILSYMIDQEFFWQEQALRNIVENGYQPERYSHIRVLEMRKADQRAAYILLDGNHRASALSALGTKTLLVQRDKGMIVREADVANWPEVRNGRRTAEDALAIFNAYFQGNPHMRTTQDPAPIIGHEDWKNLYLEGILPRTGHPRPMPSMA